MLSQQTIKRYYKTWGASAMNSPLSPFSTQNYPFCRLKLVVKKRLNTQLNESANQKSPKLLSQRIRKGEINSPLSPLSLA